MSLDSFIPTIWSRQLLTSLKKRHVFGQTGVVNRDYEGEIRAAGDTVKINAIGPVTIGNYTKNTNIAAPEDLDAAQTWLTIDQQKYFNFQVDDIDRAQQRPQVMAQAMREAAYGLANALDQYLNGIMVAGLAADNTLGTTTTPETITSNSDAYEFLVDLRTILEERNVPDDGMRWAIVPPWFEGILLKDDRFTEAPMASPFTNVAMNAQIRFVAGLNIMTSNNLTHETPGQSVPGQYSYVLVGHPMATSLAEQIVQVEAYRPELRFADAVKGLHVYGAKVVRPEALAALIVDRPQ